MTSCCCLYHLSADDETSNVSKRSVKNVRTRFGSLLYINIKPGMFFSVLAVAEGSIIGCQGKLKVYYF